MTRSYYLTSILCIDFYTNELYWNKFNHRLMNIIIVVLRNADTRRTFLLQKRRKFKPTVNTKVMSKRELVIYEGKILCLYINTVRHINLK